MLYDDFNEARTWNEALATYEGLANTYGLTTGAAVIETAETDFADTYVEGGDHTPDVLRWNWLVTSVSRLRAAVQQDFDALLVADPHGDTANMDWGDIAEYIERLDGGFTQATVTPNTDLGGGHGKGTYWRVVGLTSGNAVTGSVPDNTHGAGDGALGGAQGAVRDAIELYNWEVAAAAAAVTWPSGV